MGTNLMLGLRYLFRGIRFFYTHPAYWFYAAVPFLILSVVYIGVFWAVIAWLAPFLTGLLPVPPESYAWIDWIIMPVRWLIHLTLWISAAFLAVTVAANLYEILGALFFDAMVLKIEKNIWGIEHTPVGGKQNFMFILQTVGYASVTLILTLLFFVLGLFIPFAGPILMIIFIGYRFGMSYLFAPSFARGEGISVLRKKLKCHRMALLTFGSGIYILLLIPFTAIFLLPAFSSGGVLLYNRLFPPENLSGK